MESMVLLKILVFAKLKVLGIICALFAVTLAVQGGHHGSSSYVKLRYHMKNSRELKIRSRKQLETKCRFRYRLQMFSSAVAATMQGHVVRLEAGSGRMEMSYLILVYTRCNFMMYLNHGSRLMGVELVNGTRSQGWSCRYSSWFGIDVDEDMVTSRTTIYVMPYHGNHSHMTVGLGIVQKS